MPVILGCAATDELRRGQLGCVVAWVARAPAEVVRDVPLWVGCVPRVTRTDESAGANARTRT